MWITNPPKGSNGFQIRWNGGTGGIANPLERILQHPQRKLIFEYFLPIPAKNTMFVWFSFKKLADRDYTNEIYISYRLRAEIRNFGAYGTKLLRCRENSRCYIGRQNMEYPGGCGIADP